MLIGALILAAGVSARFGSDKRKALLPGGNSILATTLQLYASQFDRLVLVLRAGDDDLGSALPKLPNMETLYSEEARGGMGSSLADGASYIYHLPESWNFVFIALGDMPFVQPQSLQALYGEAHRLLEMDCQHIILPEHDGSTGHPVGFSVHFLPELTQVSGDQGARSVIQAHPEQINRLQLSDPGILQDIDYPAK